MMPNPTKKLLALVLCFLLISTSQPLSSAQEETSGIPFSLCDSPACWARSTGTLSADGKLFTEAPASLYYEMNPQENTGFVLQCVLPEAVDATGYDYLEFDLYLERADLFTLGAGQLELTSSGKCDVAELCYPSTYLNTLGLKEGWNHLCLPLSQGTLNSQTDEQFDPIRVNFFRLYLMDIDSSIGTLAFRLDNIFFTDGTGGWVSRNQSTYSPPDYVMQTDHRVYGDLDGNNTINAADALRILQYSVKLITLGHKQLACSDVDNSGQINASDALNVLQYSVGLIQQFSVTEGYQPANSPEVGVNGSHLVNPFFQTDEAVVAVTDVVYWGACGDGLTDDSLAFQKAIDYAGALGGGTVFVPAGNYVLRKNLAIPSGVTLKGDSPAVTTDEVQGTLLMAYAGRGQEDGAAFLSMYQGSGVENLSIFYPEQSMADIVPYPWTIDMTEVHGICVQNVRLVNSYRGIRLGNGNGNALQNIRGVTGTVLKTGLFIDYNVDICRLEDITFTPDCWIGSGLSDTSAQETMRQYVRENATGLKIEMVDWTYLTDITVKGASIGIHTSRSTIRENGGSPNGHMYGIRLLDCDTGLYAQYINSIGLLVTKGEITAEHPVVLSEEFETSLSLNSMALRSSGEHAVENLGTGALTLGNCTVETSTTTSSALSCASGRMSVLDTAFSGAGTHIRAGEDCTNILVTNCTFDGAPRLSGKANCISITTDDALCSPTIPEDFQYTEERITKPAGNHFIDLSAQPYGITPFSTQDCSDTLQQAIDDLYALGGGVVYVPCGDYLLSQPITVRPGVELRGSSDSPHHSCISSTTFHTDYGRQQPDAQALITLEGRAGVSGFKVFYTGQGSQMGSIVPYACTIRGKGIHVYVLNVTLINPYVGVDFDTYRCDGHTVNGLTGAPLRHGVMVGGGSVNGLVRDVQFNPHYYSGFNGATIASAFEYQMHNAQTFVVRDTVGEMMYNNFVYGALSGLCIENGADVSVLGHGTDGGNQSLTASGSPKKPITMVNSQLVVYGQYGDIMTYIRLSKDFTGTLNLIQTNLWGTPTQAIEAAGGTLCMTQGNILRCGAMGIVNTGADTQLSGMRFAQSDVAYDWYVDNGALAATAFGNLYASNGGKGKAADLAGVLRGTDFVKE